MSPMSASIPTEFFLNDGNKIPAVGMGCWMGVPGRSEQAYKMVLDALKAGYRHFDTAMGYGNEEALGRALKDSGVPREEIYVVSKLSNEAHHRVEEAVKETIAALGTYLDLYLVHWPQATKEPGDFGWKIKKKEFFRPDEKPTVVDTWKQMEKLLETGKVKSIGVSNFSVKTLYPIFEQCKVVPAVNQVELHPYLPMHDLKKFCDRHKIFLTAYTPLGKGGELLEDPTILRIAEVHKSTPAQVVLSWGVLRGIAVIPKSENPERMKQNISLVPLTENEIFDISSIHREPGKHKTLVPIHNPDGTVFGWTYEELGWPMKTGGIWVDETA